MPVCDETCRKKPRAIPDVYELSNSSITAACPFLLQPTECVPVWPKYPRSSTWHRPVVHRAIPHQEYLPLLFFERAKRALEARDVYDNFLKLLNMYTPDIFELKTVIIRAEKFLADDMLHA